LQLQGSVISLLWQLAKFVAYFFVVVECFTASLCHSWGPATWGGGVADPQKQARTYLCSGPKSCFAETCCRPAWRIEV